MKVLFNDTVLADSNDTIVVEGNHYFPPASINKDVFTDSSSSTVCAWKGTASYYNVNVDGNVSKDVAWYYPEPSAKAENIRGYVAFYKNKVTFA
ncbi:NTP-transf-9 domain-containing protein [Mycena indigotica]|uniref:NTP-transf-9 domain-containing protein n=1 Tax=Mycena indigotica TaxID=2126181 RepID=A0A8H6SI05_9AGAR|nr:NTP-transf-9 domain-containing protein [Mycena indigotica]KAF7299227.1 NTP-transf-9 domain-containing protein [Mycena indigotica]